jgi:hypothetical protein
MTKIYSTKEKMMERFKNLPILSICVCTILERKDMYISLSNKIMNQIHKVSKKYNYVVANLHTHANNHLDIGTKRNNLLNDVQGHYIVFIDDDDDICDDYVELIIDAIISNENVDCIGIKGIITTDNIETKKWEISKDFGSWYESNNVYYRTPNHISPIKTELARLSGGFPPLKQGEDYQYSMNVLPLLKTEIKIDKEIYHYQYNSKK